MKISSLKLDENLIGKYEIKRWPKLRNLVVDLMWTSKFRNIVHGFGEIDISIPRKIIREMNKKGNDKISFTGYLIYCLAQAIEKHKYMNALRKKNKVYIFNEVDISTIIEKEVEGVKFPTNYIIRRANYKSLEEISKEIYAEKHRIGEDPERKKQIEWFIKLPTLIRKLYWKKIMKNPLFHKQTSGTVGVTAIGMFTEGLGWAIPITPKTLTLTVGGIGERAVRGPNGDVLWKEFLSVTFSIDHDLIDGAPATRFINYFGNLLMKGFGLES
ncbi:MAG: 2-oxo acid dehydrogenase subunit E2 [Promethearchaeota archaeon]